MADRSVQKARNEVPRQTDRSATSQGSNRPTCPTAKAAGQTTDNRSVRRTDEPSTDGPRSNRPNRRGASRAPDGRIDGTSPRTRLELRQQCTTTATTLDHVLQGWRGDPADLVAELHDGTAAAQLLAHIAAHRPAFMDHAACAQPQHRHVPFFPGRGGSCARALAVCAACPVLDDCRRWALSDPDPTEGAGIAAGMTPRHRHAARLTARSSDTP